jgi:hypothetical protein
MTPFPLIALVEAMRRAQRDYFKARTPEALAGSKAAERAVDDSAKRHKGDEFAELVGRLRAKQVEYFAGFHPTVLREAKDLERRVDARLAEFKGGGTRSLFDADPEPEPPAPHVAGSATSEAAAAAIEPHAATLRGQVLAFIRSRGERGATDEEMQDLIPMPSSTQRPRRVELWRARQIVPAELQRKTKSGRLAVVWVAASSNHPDGVA